MQMMLRFTSGLKIEASNSQGPDHHFSFLPSPSRCSARTRLFYFFTRCRVICSSKCLLVVTTHNGDVPVSTGENSLSVFFFFWCWIENEPVELTESKVEPSVSSCINVVICLVCKVECSYQNVAARFSSFTGRVVCSTNTDANTITAIDKQTTAPQFPLSFFFYYANRFTQNSRKYETFSSLAERRTGTNVRPDVPFYHLKPAVCTAR